ncbi:MAG: DNA-binding protein [Pseudopedobacter saltans]|uniref:DNA-binding protein n=1 Tax=Pseudopedobacter saltans TaxID=151895 RepID=A0A2W5H7P8_9SPHI|nr:MAG: DNA-binding protein [Pseudopedobacter saltans]
MGITILQSLRESKNWTQEYVAEVLDITQSAYARLEAGKTKLTIDRAKELANVFAVPPEAFFATSSDVINYNTGNGSFGGPIYGYNNYVDSDTKSLYERILQDKNNHISTLSKEIMELRKEKEQLIHLIEKIAEK